MEELYTTKQVQDLLQVDRITVYRMLKDGRLTGVKVGKQWRFKPSEIEALVSEGTKPIAVPQPKYAPNEVLPIHCIQVIQDIFAEMNDIGSVTTGIDGIPITEVSHSCEFCNLILASPTGKQACVESWKKLAHSAKGEPKFFRCHAGFQYARGRIELHGDLTAIQVAGQFLLSPPEEGELNAIIEDLSEQHQIEKNKLTTAAKSIRVISEERQSKIGRWLKEVAKTFEVIAHERADLLHRLKNIAAMSSFEV